MRVELPHLDVMCLSACQLRCVSCTNAMGIVPMEVWPAEDVKRDITAAAEVMHANVACLLGGEPLSHPDLVDLMRFAATSGLADRVQVLTNGMRLHLMKEAFWGSLDWLKISIYPGKTQPENVQLAKQRAADLGFRLDFYDVASDPFRAVHRKETASPEIAQRTYDGCWYKTFTRKVQGGRFYRCCTSPTISQELLGMAPEDDDGIALDGLTPDDLREFLARPTYMDSCTRCYGNTGPRLDRWSEERDKTRWLEVSSR